MALSVQKITSIAYDCVRKKAINNKNVLKLMFILILLIEWLRLNIQDIIIKNAILI